LSFLLLMLLYFRIVDGPPHLIAPKVQDYDEIDENTGLLDAAKQLSIND
jgi:hypothetical protein